MNISRNITTQIQAFAEADGQTTAVFQKGVTAYEKGDYKTAFEVWRPLAEKGLSSAQYNLAVMYYGGYGVRKNDTKAVYWLKKAAYQRHPMAQNDLGCHYMYGQGVERNLINAYMWFGFAALNLSMIGEREDGVLEDRALAASNRDLVAKQMSLSQVEEAQRLAGENLGRFVVGEGAGWED